jgi:hypothetical protein
MTSRQIMANQEKDPKNIGLDVMRVTQDHWCIGSSRCLTLLHSAAPQIGYAAVGERPTGI